MKTLILGIRHQTGIGKESGQPYDMRTQLVIASPMESLDRQNLKVRAVGYEAMTIECAPEVFNELVKLPLQKFPIALDLDLSSRKRGEQAVSYVESIRQAA